ncbi:hypothetical protein MKJ01_14140 [Chryseobacterium sp. SSA4.19]|uniref:hypothetical protein n=1 Tax=Chryseobacterium sp. SSA4.19 TaxID=2919915 RepID=UPI001F4E9F25|nr:hypothetical protein [Chryseobacterium sp. SSA4.19]MCJ8154906.1 hypothetical protein [Chryseobacterium sp. SSA4.19]
MSVRGSFYFKITVTGNLIGEYFNNYSNVSLSKSANRINPGIGFVGQYVTSWSENQTSAEINKLTIEEISTNMFKLIWTDMNGKETFHGKASLLEKNIIYGYYSGEQFIQEH